MKTSVKGKGKKQNENKLYCPDRHLLEL